MHFFSYSFFNAPEFLSLYETLTVQYWISVNSLFSPTVLRSSTPAACIQAKKQLEIQPSSNLPSWESLQISIYMLLINNKSILAWPQIHGLLKLEWY